MLACTALFQQALAGEWYYSTTMSVDNQTSQTFYITVWTQNMQDGSQASIVPPNTTTQVYSGEDDSDTNTVYINGFNGMTIVYNGDNTMSSSTVTQAINLAGIGGVSHTYQYGVLLPANLNNQNNCATDPGSNGQWQGGISPICVSSTNFNVNVWNNYQGTGSITFVIPPNFPQPRSLPS